jgi:hypothetical protein
MSGLDDRESAFENKYAHEEKLSFDVEARCSKLFGLWAAEKLGLGESDAKTYALEVVSSNLEEAGFEDVLRKVKGDFEAKGVSVSEREMKLELDKALTEARRQMTA